MSLNLIHGGDWAGFVQEYGTEPLDFSANISPLGVPEGVQKALRGAASAADRYPDPLCRDLRTAIGASEGIPPEQVLCGNGAADLIFRIPLALRPRRALVTAPTFAEYEAALHTVDCTVERMSLAPERKFHLGSDILQSITPETDLVFLCEPNNPTGVTTPRPLLEEILARCRETGTHLVVDECFGDLLEDPEAHTLKGYLDDFPNLLILKAFTKLYAMAGVRLGYLLCGDQKLLESLARAGQPWAVSTLAQAAGVAALKEDGYVRQVRAFIARERPWLLEHLERLGLQVIPGEANYLLFWSEKPLLEPMRRRGILLRDCANYQGLQAGWYRTAVRTRRENERLLSALEECLR